MLTIICLDTSNRKNSSKKVCMQRFALVFGVHWNHNSVEPFVSTQKIVSNDFMLFSQVYTLTFSSKPF